MISVSGYAILEKSISFIQLWTTWILFVSIIRVLLADDNAVFRHGLRKLLESDARMMVVGEARDGPEAVSLAARHRPDVVLLDIRMPGIDGLAAAREIKDATPEVTIIILTSYDTPALRSLARETGVRAYLRKGIGEAELLRHIRGA